MRDHIDLIREFEGLRLDAYRDQGGVWTIGYGHTRTAKHGMTITQGEAEALLDRDLAWAESAVDRLVSVPISAPQRSALISWVYNIGETQARKSTLIRRLNEGDYACVPDQLRLWVHVSGERSRGLARRREAEIAVWLHRSEPLKPLRRSRTLWGAAAAVITTLFGYLNDALGAVGEAASRVDVEGARAGMAGLGGEALDLMDRLQPAFMLLIVAWIVWARIDDRRKERR